MPIYGAPPNGTQPNWVEPIDGRFASGVGTYAANLASLVWFRVRRSVTVSNCTISISVQSGNVEVGLYQSDGTTLTKLASSGSTAVGGVGQQTIALGSAVTLRPGVDYFAVFAADNATASFGRLNGASATASFNAKAMQKATSFPLPATFTIAGLSAGAASFWSAWTP